MKKYLYVSSGVVLSLFFINFYLKLTNNTKTNNNVEKSVVESNKKDKKNKQKVINVLKIKNNKNNSILLKGNINKSSSEKIIQEIKEKSKLNKTLWLLIDSPGGSVIDGAGIITEIENTTATINTVCLKLCASMAFIIHQYGKNRYNLNRSILMAHNAHGRVEGDIPNMMNLLTTIQKYINKMNTYIALRANMELKEYENLISNDFWIDAEDAFHTNFSDGLVSIEYIGFENEINLFNDENNILKDFKW